MKEVKVGIIRESRIPADKRAPLSPEYCKKLQKQYPDLQIMVQPCKNRVFSDREYANAGVAIRESLAACDYLFGVKEVATDRLIPGKTYFFFSHTTKKQPQNRLLLKAILKNNVRLIDYECLRDTQGKRMVAFGYFAGLVGAYNAILTYGKKYNLFYLKSAYQCYDLQALRQEFKKCKLPPVKIALTGNGNVAKGAIDLLKEIGVIQVGPQDYIHNHNHYPVFTQLRSFDYNKPKNGGSWRKEDFYKHPENYVSVFHKYSKVTDILISGAYWNPDAPKLFSKDEMRQNDFSIKVIADVTCDIGGPIPCTLKATSINHPVYDYNPFTEEAEPAYTSENNISVMAVDNLPCELARDASENFSEQLYRQLFPLLLGNDPDAILEKATIARSGHLTPAYAYLNDYVLSEDE